MNWFDMVDTTDVKKMYNVVVEKIEAIIAKNCKKHEEKKQNEEGEEHEFEAPADIYSFATDLNGFISQYTFHSDFVPVSGINFKSIFIFFIDNSVAFFHKRITDPKSFKLSNTYREITYASRKDIESGHVKIFDDIVFRDNVVGPLIIVTTNKGFLDL